MTEVGYVRVTDEARMERKNVAQGGIFGGRSGLFELQGATGESDKVR